MIKIAIVDDKRLNRINRAEEIKKSAKIKVVFTAQNGLEFLEKIKETSDEEKPDVVLMDIDMPEMNGIEAVRHSKLIYPQIEFIMLTVFDEDTKIFEAIKAGASGYLLKDESTSTIIDFIQQVKEFRTVPMSPAVARKALKLLSESSKETIKTSNAISGLTSREKEVLSGMVNGLDYKEIATSLSVSPNTVRNQISSIYQKLHVSCKVDAVKIAIKNNLLG